MSCQKSDCPGQGSMTCWLASFQVRRSVELLLQCLKRDLQLQNRWAMHTMAIWRKGQLALQPTGESGVTLSTLATQGWAIPSFGCEIRVADFSFSSLAQLWTWKPTQCSAQRNLKLKLQHLHGWGICTKYTIYRKLQHCRLGFMHTQSSVTTVWPTADASRELDLLQSKMQSSHVNTTLRQS